MNRATWHKQAPAYAPLLLLGVMGVEQRWIGDDGFINLRVAEQILAGNGFVFNAGERVEAVTSPLWLGLVTGLGALGISLSAGAVWMGLLLTLLGAASATWGCIRLSETTDEERGVWLPVGSLIYAAVPASWDYATSGLENGLSTAFLGLTFLALSSALARPSAQAERWAALAAGLGPLVRPDFGLFSLVFCAFALGLAARRGLFAFALSLPWLLVPNASYQLFRMGYFASLVPNTGLAKEAFDPRWEQGSLYFLNTFALYELWWPLAAAGVLLVASMIRYVRSDAGLRATLLFATAFASALHLTYVVRVGGDFMHARMLLPGLFALTVPCAAFSFGFERRRVLSLLPLMVVFLWAGYCASTLRVAEQNEHGIGDERGWHARKAQVKNPTTVEEYVRFHFHAEAQAIKTWAAKLCPHGEQSLASDSRDRCARRVFLVARDGVLSDKQATLPLDPRSAAASVVAVVARRPLGIASGLLGLRINLIDHYGLADPVAARLTLSNRGRPGHEKEFGTVWIAARYAKPGATSDKRVASARHALSCGDLALLVQAVRAPMSWSRFWSNVGLSFRFHTLRVPQNAHTAERVFCG